MKANVQITVMTYHHDRDRRVHEALLTCGPLTVPQVVRAARLLNVQAARKTLTVLERRGLVTREVRTRYVGARRSRIEGASVQRRDAVYRAVRTEEVR